MITSIPRGIAIIEELFGGQTLHQSMHWWKLPQLHHYMHQASWTTPHWSPNGQIIPSVSKGTISLRRNDLVTSVPTTTTASSTCSHSATVHPVTRRAATVAPPCGNSSRDARRQQLDILV
ncbi:hypothetical protein NP493_19g01002 [Ridgeia piscesae]|uniref:Uncharacterized protein n=1 Tax=Ridgeia piscesae TaxID=27915 RepID=A0AAD9PDU2_RIDPI|nr:hypothetical protein NP493_19g01002 [Ridgeia piscesae]